MNGMHYEKLMKMAHQCHYNGVRGANAEIYRNMDRVIRELQFPEISHHPVDQLEYIAKIAIGEVRGYTETAIRKAITMIKNAEDKDTLNNLLLTIPTNSCERQALDNAISKAIDILVKNNIVVP